MGITIARLQKLIDGKVPIVGIRGPTTFSNSDLSCPTAGKWAIFRILGSLTLAKWYAGCGAAPLVDEPLSLLLPLATIEAALKATGKLPG
ncbi:MAG: hypothetical protein WB507_08675 [Solirubrobacterales bacterium]